MRCRFRPAVVLAILILARPVPAAAPADLLALVPDVAEFVLKIEQPRKLIDLLLGPATRPELQGFRGYREAPDSTGFRRGQQLVEYFEKELGRPWPELVDRLAGGGIVVAAKFEPNALAVTILRGTDPPLAEKFLKLALETIEQERARQGQPGGYSQEMYRDATLWKLGELHAAAIDGTLVYANQAMAMKAVIDRIREPGSKSILDSAPFKAAAELRPDQPLAWAWISLEQATKAKELEPLFAFPANFFPIPVTFGGLIDVVKRSPYLVVALHAEKDATVFSLRFPRGTSGMHDLVRGHAPPTGEAGALPLLAPLGVLYSNSYYLDLASFWQKRQQLLPPDQLAAGEDANENSKVLFAGTKFSDLLAMAGPRQRIVVAAQREPGYKTEPANRLPSFAWVWQLRQPEEFQKSMEGPLQVLGYFTAIATPHQRSEETRAGAKLTTYRFFENDKNKAIDNGILFNFSPSFARVKDQFIFSSTVELARDLVDLLGKETPQPAAPEATVQSRFFPSGLNTALTAAKRQLVAQNILEQGNTPAEAEREVALYLKLLESLGHFDLNTLAEPERYRVELRMKEWKK